MFYDSKTQLIQFTDQQKGTKNVTCTICWPDKNKVEKSTGKLELNFPKIHSNINICVSWHFQIVMHNLWTRFTQFRDQKKVWNGTSITNRTFHKKQYYKVSNKLMLTLLDISEICSMIQRLNSCNLLTGKVAEKVPCTIYRPDKKSKKNIGELEMNFP